MKLNNYLFVVAITLVLTGAYLSRRLQTNYLSQLEQSLSAQAQLMQKVVTPLLGQPTRESLHDAAHRVGNDIGLRVTVIRADGQVYGDSERTIEGLLQMDNHRSRPEIVSALAAGKGESTRYSRTLNAEMLYLAFPILAPGAPSPWGVLRVAMPLTEVDRRVRAFHFDLLLAGAAAMAVALIVAFIVLQRTRRPLLELTQAARQIDGEILIGADLRNSQDEFGELARAFHEMSRRIQEKVEELSRERTQLSAILSSLVEGVIAVDHEGQILLLNAAAEKLFGVSSKDTRGRPALEVLRHQALYTVMQETLQQGRSVSHEVTIHSPQERTLKVQSVPMSYGEGHTGVLAAFYDITELRRLETLRQEFVANVSHELKTPLTAIKGYVDTLLEGAIEDPQHNREFLKIIEEHTRHLTLLIDDVLDLSAIEAKRVQLHMESVSLSDLVSRLIKGLAPMAKAKQVTIENSLSEALPKVLADRDKLAQILMNLLDNAIKFNRNQGTVTIKAAAETSQLILTIRDTGIGIAPADLPRIFERFYRADKAHSHDIAGTGLGLAIVKHLLDAHQGTISVTSVPGEGSTFVITLPFA